MRYLFIIIIQPLFAAIFWMMKIQTLDVLCNTHLISVRSKNPSPLKALVGLFNKRALATA